jgi:hypothetical protein
MTIERFLLNQARKQAFSEEVKQALQEAEEYGYYLGYLEDYRQRDREEKKK